MSFSSWNHAHLIFLWSWKRKKTLHGRLIQIATVQELVIFLLVLVWSESERVEHALDMAKHIVTLVCFQCPVFALFFCVFIHNNPYLLTMASKKVGDWIWNAEVIQIDTLFLTLTELIWASLDTLLSVQINIKAYNAGQ